LKEEDVVHHHEVHRHDILQKNNVCGLYADDIVWFLFQTRAADF